MGQPEWIRTLPYHEVEEIRALSQREKKSGGPVPIDSKNCNIHFLAAVMPSLAELTPILCCIFRA